MEIYSGKRSDNKKLLFPTSFCRTRERSNLTLLRSPSRDPLLLLFSPIIPESFLNSALYFLLLNLPLFSEASGNEKMYCVERKSRGGQKSTVPFRMKRAPFFFNFSREEWRLFPHHRTDTVPGEKIFLNFSQRVTYLYVVKSSCVFRACQRNHSSNRRSLHHSQSNERNDDRGRKLSKQSWHTRSNKGHIFWYNRCLLAPSPEGDFLSPRVIAYFFSSRYTLDPKWNAASGRKWTDILYSAFPLLEVFETARVFFCGWFQTVRSIVRVL